jgi:hypothetical protein
MTARSVHNKVFGHMSVSNFRWRTAAAGPRERAVPRRLRLRRGLRAPSVGAPRPRAAWGLRLIRPAPHHRPPQHGLPGHGQAVRRRLHPVPGLHRLREPGQPALLQRIRHLRDDLHQRQAGYID